jgi:hypothetical protein
MKFYLIAGSFCIAILVMCFYALYAFSHLESLSSLWR